MRRRCPVRARQKLDDATGKVKTLEEESKELAWYGMGRWRNEPDSTVVWTIGNMNQKLKEVSLKHERSQQVTVCPRHHYPPLTPLQSLAIRCQTLTW